MAGLGAGSANAGTAASSSQQAERAAPAVPVASAAVAVPASSMLVLSWDVVPGNFPLPLGPQFGAWRSWSWANRWHPESPWCPRKRQLERLVTATWRSQSSFWYVYLPSQSRVELERNRDRVDNESIRNVIIFFIFQQTKYSPEDPSVCTTMSSKTIGIPELKNTANWMVALSNLYEESIKNRMRGGNKSYNKWVQIYLHFFLIV